MGYFLRRTGFFLATLWAAITLNFLIPRLQPGDPAEAIVSRLTGKSEAVDPNQVEAVRKLLGAPEGNLLTQYWDYLGELAHGNLGISYTYYPYTVTDVVRDAAPWTIVLVGVTTILSFIIGTLLGAWAAYRRNTPHGLRDHARARRSSGRCRSSGSRCC